MAAACALIVLATLPSGCASRGTLRAKADLVDTRGKAIGNAEFWSEDHATRIHVRLQEGALSPGKHGIHLHENGVCEGPDFKSAGPHFGATAPRRHGLSHDPGTRHLGDLPNLEVRADGSADSRLLTGQLRWPTAGAGATKTSGEAAGEGDLFKPGGTSLLIHEREDDQKTDPSGESGGRIACGVIVPANH
jgi:Cu-Zn family superoxide dismutase